MTSMPLLSHMLGPDKDKKFSALCEDAENGIAAMLIQEVNEHVNQVRLALRVNEFLDIITAEKIAGILNSLLGNIEEYPREKQRLIIGAARYFVKSNDPQADPESLLGFDDDIKVLNCVLAELGHNELRIQL